MHFTKENIRDEEAKWKKGRQYWKPGNSFLNSRILTIMGVNVVWANSKNLNII